MIYSDGLGFRNGSGLAYSGGVADSDGSGEGNTTVSSFGSEDGSGLEWAEGDGDGCEEGHGGGDGAGNGCGDDFGSGTGVIVDVWQGGHWMALLSAVLPWKLGRHPLEAHHWVLYPDKREQIMGIIALKEVTL